MMLFISSVGGAACNSKKGTESASAEAKKSAAELQRSADAARQALKAIEAPLAELNGKYDTLHKEFSALPVDLPGFADTRAQFFTAYITLGTLSTKPVWISSRIDAALKSGDSAELEAITRDTAAIPVEIGVLDKIALESLHKVMRFKKAAETYVPEQLGQTACENVDPPPAKKATSKKTGPVVPAREAKAASAE